MLGWILRLVLLLIVVRMIWRFLAGLVDGIAGPRPRAGAGRGEAVPLVRDPVCGTYVVKSRALAAVAGGETAFFCSEACRDTWRARHAGSRSA